MESLTEQALVVIDFVDSYHAGSIRSEPNPDIRAYEASVYAAHYLHRERSRLEEFRQGGYVGPTDPKVATEFLEAAAEWGQLRGLISREQAASIANLMDSGPQGLDRALHFATGLTANIELAADVLRRAVSSGTLSGPDVSAIAGIPDSGQRAQAALEGTWKDLRIQRHEEAGTIHPWRVLESQVRYAEIGEYKDRNVRQLLRHVHTSLELLDHPAAPETSAANYYRSAVYLAEKIGLLSSEEANDFRSQHVREGCRGMLQRLIPLKHWNMDPRQINDGSS